MSILKSWESLTLFSKRLLMLFSKSFIVLVYMVRSIIYKKVLFLLMWNTNGVSEFYFFIYKYLISLAIFIESAILLALSFHFVKNQKFMYAWFFTSHAIWFVCTMITHYLNFYTSSIFTLFSYDVLALYSFHANFRISLSCVKNKVTSELWRLHWIWIKLTQG